MITMTVMDELSECWKKTFILILVLCIASFSFFFNSWASIVTIWYHSSTFTHGFLIIPISVWLIWTRKEDYLKLQPKISNIACIAIFLSGFLWLLADLISVQVIMQFSTVALFISGLWFILGTELVKNMAFPLGFLFFMVPVGEELVPPLMEFTADFTVGLIRLTGMSVFREGLHFSLTSGNWSVVEACSGISYLIASVTLGVVYAYLTYERLWKRCLFILLAMIIPVIANGVRAYLIVMIGHFSNMTLAVGIDHLIYGGLFFGLVMMILFYLGSFWRDTIKTSEALIIIPVVEESVRNRGVTSMVLIVSFMVWPMSAYYLSLQVKNSDIPDYNASTIIEWNDTKDPLWRWHPSLPGAKQQKINYFQKNNYVLGVFKTSFGEEQQGEGELISSQNLVLAKKDPYWKIIQHQSVSINGLLTVDETVMSGTDKDLISVRWYRMGDYETANQYKAKLYQLFKRLTASSSPEYLMMITIAAPKNKHEQARQHLEAFIMQWLAKD